MGGTAPRSLVAALRKEVLTVRVRAALCEGPHGRLCASTVLARAAEGRAPWLDALRLVDGRRLAPARACSAAARRGLDRLDDTRLGEVAFVLGRWGTRAQRARGHRVLIERPPIDPTARAQLAAALVRHDDRAAAAVLAAMLRGRSAARNAASWATFFIADAPETPAIAAVVRAGWEALRHPTAAVVSGLEQLLATRDPARYVAVCRRPFAAAHPHRGVFANRLARLGNARDRRAVVAWALQHATPCDRVFTALALHHHSALPEELRLAALRAARRSPALAPFVAPLGPT